MAQNGSMIVDATLLTLVAQQEEILKCVQSRQGYSIGEYLGRLDEKVDKLLASGFLSREAAEGEVLTSAECHVAGVPSDAFTPRQHREGFVQDDMSLTVATTDSAGGALQRSVSLQATSPGEPETCSRSSSPPIAFRRHLPGSAVTPQDDTSLTRSTTDSDMSLIGSTTDSAGGALPRSAWLEAASPVVQETCSRSSSPSTACRRHLPGSAVSPQDDMSLTGSTTDSASGALQRSASLEEASLPEPRTCSRPSSRSRTIKWQRRTVSFNLPHCVSEAIDEDAVRVFESPTEFADGAFERKALPQTASCGEPETSSRFKAINEEHGTVPIDWSPCVSEAMDVEAVDEVINEAASPSPILSPSYMKNKSNSRSKSLRKHIIEKRRRDLLAEQPMLVRITNSAYFEAVGSALIILNVLSICWQTQVTASRVEDAFVSGAAYSDSVPAVFVATQLVFTFSFVLEVGMRWAATGLTQFVCNGDWLWNMFDIFIVSAGLLQQFSWYLSEDSGMVSIMMVRCLRVLRLLRVFRTLRYFVLFRELRMLINTCLGGLMSYMWFCCIAFLLVLVFGITLTTRTYTYLMTSEQYADDESAILLQRFFGTLDRSMLSLVEAASGGRDWHELYALLRMVGSFDSMLMLCFLSFFIYVLGNAAAAVFVESAMTHARRDTELVIKEQLDRDSVSRKKFLDVFEEMDSNGDGTLSLEEFNSHLKDDRVVAYFDAFQLDVSYAPQIFSLLDVDGSGQVELDEFIDGCIKLRGEARQLKLYEIQHSMSSIDLSLRRINRFLSKQPPPNAASMQGGRQASSAGRTWPG